MDVQQFEQAILKMAFETDAKITTASVAYYLGIPSRSANALLNELLEQGVLELDSDANGNLFYSVPQHDMGSVPIPPRAEAQPVVAPEPVRALVPNNYFASLDDDTGEAFSPSSQAPPRPAPVAAPTPERHATTDGSPGVAKAPRPSFSGFDDYFKGGNGADGSDGSSGTRQPVMAGSSPVLHGVSTQLALPDASLDACGGSALLVSQEARCDPNPLPAARPVIISCDDYGANPPVRQAAPRPTPSEEHSWFAAPHHGAMVPAGEAALVDYIEQPEHQPGMALLLSLILCGTGQIYNGEVSKGVMMMVLCFLLWFVLLGWVVHIWSIVDAVVVAERLNRRHASS